jgi:DNA polymerase elongation subunit (family B)
MAFYTSVHRVGANILYRGYNDNGVAIQERIRFKPTYFVQSNKPNPTWHSLDGVPVEPMEFDSINEAKEFIDTYKDVENFKVYGNTNYVAQFIASKFPGNIKFDMRHIAVGNFDIEVKSDDGFPFPEHARHEVISIAYKNSKSHIYHVWGLQNYDATKATGIPEGHLVRYVRCDDELDLLMKFMTYWENNYPDVITGWNVRLFDIPYLINRIRRVLGDDWVKKFSPWGMVNYRQINVKNKNLDTYEIYGVGQLDYLDLFQKFGYVFGTQESYALDHIAHVVLGERKLSYEEYGSLHSLYENDYQNFVNYNIRDVVLVDKIENRARLLELALILAYKGGANYGDTLGTTAIWDSIIYRYLNERNIAIPPASEKHRPEFPGGYVKDPVVGKHKWVVSFDLNSLYPMTIVQYNMSPETLVDGMDVGFMPKNEVDYYLEGGSIPDRARELDLAVAANGSMYRRDKQGVLPAIIEGLYAERDATKKKMLAIKQKYEETKDAALKSEAAQLDNTQHAIKILLNSLYGALGNKHFRYFDIRIAEGVTTSGQLADRWAEKAMNEAMNKIMKTSGIEYVFYADTDSIYVNMTALVDQVNPPDPVAFLDKACSQKFEPIIEGAYEKLFIQMNAFKNKMKMKREVIADAGIWCAHPDTIINVNDEDVRIGDYFSRNQTSEGANIIDVGNCDDEVLSFDLNTHAKTNDRIELALRRWYEGDMYELEFDGRTVHVTPEHLVLTRTEDGTLSWVKAKDLIEEHELILT